MTKYEKFQLTEELWLKYSYEDKQGLKSDRKKIIEDYERITGEHMSMNLLKSRIRRLDSKVLYESKSFNERTDEIIDEPTQLYTPHDLMISMGVDPEEFEMDSTTVNRWWLDKGDILERIRNGQLKIRIKPKKFEITESLLDRLISKNVEPIIIEKKVQAPHGLYEFTMTDAHFGNNSFDDYKETFEKTLHWIDSQDWDTILMPIGNDLFHWDNVLGTTTAGTQVGFEPDLDFAWEQAMLFYKPIIELAIQRGENVYMPYVPGNHDTTLGWAFAKALKELYPQVIHDTRNNNYKIFTWEKVAIGLSHGSNPRDFKKYARIFNELFRKEFAHAEVREIHLGDKHHQMVFDEYGVVTRGLSTRAKVDQWHYNGGYIGASDCFQAFIYSKSAIEAMLFI